MSEAPEIGSIVYDRGHGDDMRKHIVIGLPRVKGAGIFVTIASAWNGAVRSFHVDTFNDLYWVED